MSTCGQATVCLGVKKLEAKIELWTRLAERKLGNLAVDKKSGRTYQVCACLPCALFQPHRALKVDYSKYLG